MSKFLLAMSPEGDASAGGAGTGQGTAVAASSSSSGTLGSGQGQSSASTGTGQGSSGISESWAKSWIQPDFTLNASALDRLPDHLKGLRPTLERQKNFEGVLMALDHASTLAGKKALAPLPAGSAPEVQAERKQLLDTINGVPSKPQEYGIARPADFPEAHWNQKLADSFTTWAHKHSVSPAAAKELVFDIQANAVKESLVSQAQYETQFWAGQQQQFEATIRRENIPADRANALVEKGALALGLDMNNEATKTFMKGAESRLMAMRHAIAIGEDSSGAGLTANGGADRDPAALAHSAMKDPSDPLYAAYWNRDGKYSRTDHEAAVAKVNGWFQQAEARNPRRGAARK